MKPSFVARTGLTCPDAAMFIHAICKANGYAIGNLKLHIFEKLGFNVATVYVDEKHYGGFYEQSPRFEGHVDLLKKFFCLRKNLSKTSASWFKKTCEQFHTTVELVNSFWDSIEKDLLVLEVDTQPNDRQEEPKEPDRQKAPPRKRSPVESSESVKATKEIKVEGKPADALISKTNSTNRSKGTRTRPEEKVAKKPEKVAKSFSTKEAEARSIAAKELVNIGGNPIRIPDRFQGMWQFDPSLLQKLKDKQRWIDGHTIAFENNPEVESWLVSQGCAKPSFVDKIYEGVSSDIVPSGRFCKLVKVEATDKDCYRVYLTNSDGGSECEVGISDALLCSVFREQAVKMIKACNTTKYHAFVRNIDYSDHTFEIGFTG